MRKQYLIKVVCSDLSDDRLDKLLLEVERSLNSDMTTRVHIEEVSNTKTTLEMAGEFHKTFGLLYDVEPNLPDNIEHDFRVGFIHEEAGETNTAYLEHDLVKYADGLADIQYVLDGWFHSAGLHDKKQAIMEEIHRSNLTKACYGMEQVIQTITKLRLENPETFYHYEQHGPVGTFVVYRSADRKVMKSVNYQPPNLKEIIHGTRVNKNTNDGQGKG